MTFQIRGIWLLIFVAAFSIAVYLFFSKGCTPSNTTPSFSQEKEDSIRNEQAILRAERVRDSVLAAIQMAEKQKEVDSVHTRLQIAKMQINDLIRTGATLRNQLDYYATITDTGMIDVHPSYVIACDSIAEVNEAWQYKFNDYSKECTALTNALHDQLSLGNKEIAAHKSQIGKLEHQNAWLTKGITEISNKMKPRNKVFIGFAAAGTQDKLLYGLGLGLALMNKKDQLINIDALMIHEGQLMYQVSGKFKIAGR